MGKSTSSCLKIITCGGGDSADGEDLTSVVSKASSDKPRWSFRKKSAGHQVLSNNLISEPASVGYNKENPEATTNDFNSPKKLSIPEKASIEEPSLSSAIVTPVTVVDPSIIGRNDIITDHNIEDSVAVVIQAAIRRYLAQRELRKLQNVIKLQAAVRGHLVRRQAVGTLRCIQAIVKMQALVRARQGNITSCTEPNKACTATEKLLSNRFACQLLESTPKTKRIHIKCDPSISDSSWKWLERWMAITSSVTEKQLEQNLFQAYQVQEGNSKLVAYEAANEVPVADVSVSSDSKSNPSESAVPTEGEGNSITKTSAEFQAPVSVPKDRFTSLERNDQDQRQLENEALGMAPEDDTNTDRIIEKTSASLSGQIPLLSNTTSQPVFSCEPLENEGKKFVLGSRKSCNPAFAAVQSKFEELSSTTIVSRSINPACQDALDESKYDRPNYQVDSLTKIKDLSLMENSLTHDPRNQIAASECGTEISISSTLDSPDRSEAEGGEIVLEIEALGKGNPVFDGGADNDFNHPSMKATAKSASSVSEVLQSQRVEDSNGNVGNPVAAADAQQVEQQSEEPTTSDMKNQIENLVVPQVYRSSPEGTPRSHTTAPEAHETPSSQVSVNAKKSKKDINLPAGKQITQIVVKGSPSNPNNGSGGRSSIEHLPKDSKTAKRRSSFGTAKPDHLDHEPRVSNSNSLPSYMQATESAKAKALAGISPKSSPDVHDKDNYTKKRHSLPIGNGKQELSPRMQRSSSQAQQNLKGNATHSPHNSAERRWQR